jgi:hypothetical protein
MIDYIPEITAEIAVKKFFLRELFLFFKEKRKGVILDKPFTFSVEEFANFVETKKFRNVMHDNLNYNFIKAHLESCKGLLKRNNKLRIIYPESPVLKFTPRKQINSFVVDCVTTYIETTIKFFDNSLKDDRLWDDKRKSLYRETREHKIRFLDKETKNSLENKERGIFSTLAGNFNKHCPYGDMFQNILNLYNLAPEKRLKLMHDYNSTEKQKRYIDDGIQALKKKLYEISGKSDAIKSVKGRKSNYVLTY